MDYDSIRNELIGTVIAIICGVAMAVIFLIK